MQSLDGRLKFTNGRPSGFDYMRLCLATSVIVMHTINVCYGPDRTTALMETPLRVPVALVLPMFFALSGFLVAGSLERCKTLISFIGLRFYRLIPALAVETALSALVLGVAFTTLPLRQYFAGPEFKTYFLNIAGDIHFILPGVFASNPWPSTVNLQLWTLPYEMICYAALAGLAITTIAKRRYLMLLVVVGFEAALFGYHTFLRPVGPGVTVGGVALVVSFLVGVVYYQFRDKVPWNKWLFLATLVAAVALTASHKTSYLAPFPCAYMTVYLGLLNPKRASLLLNGDYSYGLFLYGFPIQQAVTAVLPVAYRVWYIDLGIALPLTALIAAGSWWLVEKPIHDRRKVLLKIEAAILARFTWLAPSASPVTNSAT
jgi:peptidoglycan/LPS O-acetylase OafA/YrhL